MSKHVWKCEFCREYYESFDDANDHEKKCEWNPKNKFCCSCKNHSNDGFWMYGESYTCLKNLDMDHYEDEGDCKGYEEDK